jgi:TRAP transporter TAXI family solute receptor
MVLVLVGSALTWWMTLDPLPRTIRIVTAARGGLYYRFATVLAERLEERTGRSVEVVETQGSVENLELLESGGAQLAILQATSVPLEEISVLAPLWSEPLQVLARRSTGITSVADLEGRRISIGREGSGMRESARFLLERYGISLPDAAESRRYFGDMLEDPSIEAAIVTTGIHNPDLLAVLRSGDFVLLEIDQADAIGMSSPMFEALTLPRGIYLGRPAIPAVPLHCVATTAVLSAADDCSPRLVKETLGALYERDLRRDFPTLLPRWEALALAPVPLHPTAQEFFDPYRGLSTIANLIESLSGIKELIFGLGALGYLAWDQIRRVRLREKERLLHLQKERLDTYLQRTIEVERASMRTQDVKQLEAYLDSVTRLKLEAIDQLTGEELLGDRMFLIFLTQCANLIRKIQGRILTRERVLD